ncbi:hypothetical protein [Ammoniphilus sp. CFH 90114]|uniref:hypothetical protein n=1 Tax=Ammoniphilus sp. CFH 90114 TaxID=2493665 RepID=UPI00100F96DC|nr:hypothetical protein [Ammoniphilus sp. CFH 90114]RXT03579.1 hypothetical protein EIZ39_23910 [Ammoniphilus sp. CFH 90114]
MKKQLSVLLLSLLCVGCASGVNKAVIQPIESKAGSGSGIVKKLDVRMEGEMETVEVEIPFQHEDIPASWSFKIDGEEKITIDNTEDSIAHYDIQVKDLDQDQTDEILFYRFPGGSAGAVLLSIYKPEREAWKQLFHSDLAQAYGDTNRFDIRYIGDYKVSFEDKLVNHKVTIYLDPARYEGNEEFLKGIATWIDPVMNYEIKDTNGDGIQEIMTTQRVIGISHPDTLAEMLTKFELVDGTFKPVSYQLIQELAFVPLP